MIDIATTQTVAFQRHPPAAVWGMLALTLLASCVLAGYSMSGSGARNWVHILVFALLFSAVIYLNVDFEYPRMRGFIRIDDMDKLLTQTLERMKSVWPPCGSHTLTLTHLLTFGLLGAAQVADGRRAGRPFASVTEGGTCPPFGTNQTTTRRIFRIRSAAHGRSRRRTESKLTPC